MNVHGWNIQKSDDKCPKKVTVVKKILTDWFVTSFNDIHIVPISNIYNNIPNRFFDYLLSSG